MGVVFLRERFNRLQLVAIILALVAVIILTVMQGVLPWISLSLALTFALYGLIRKTVDVGPTQGFLVEVILIYPIAVAYMIWLIYSGNLVFGSAGTSNIILAKRLRLSTIGMMQYIAPTLIFLIGIFIFKEELKPSLLIAFILIWTALAIYSWSLFQDTRAQKIYAAYVTGS